MNNKKVKLINPNGFAVGLKLMDGIREVIVHPKKKGSKQDSFVYLDEDEVYYINNMSKIFSKRHLVIDDEEINQNLGYAEKTVASLTDEEIETILKGNFPKMKKDLAVVKEKHAIDRVISIAGGIGDLAQGKLKYLSEWSGYDIDQIMQSNDEDKENE